MGLNQAYQLDDLDLQILDILIKDFGPPYKKFKKIYNFFVGPNTLLLKIKIIN